jgi:hypothetical protein
MSSILRELRRQNGAPVRTATVQAAKEFSSDLADPVGCFPDQSKQLLSQLLDWQVLARHHVSRTPRRLPNQRRPNPNKLCPGAGGRLRSFGGIGGIGIGFKLGLTFPSFRGSFHPVIYMTG